MTMKRYLLWLTASLLSVLIAYATMDIQNDDDLYFGSSSQDKSAPSSEVTVTGSFTVDVTGENVSALDYTFTPQNNFDPSNIKDVDFNGVAQFNDSKSYTIDIELIVPEDFDAVDDDLDKTAFSVGDLRITGTNDAGQQTQTNPLTLHLEVQNLADITSVELDNNDAITSVSSGSTYTVTAGDSFEVGVTVTNQGANNSTGIDIDDATITILINSLNIEEDTTTGKIDSGDTATESIDIDIDEDDSGTFDVDIELAAEDEFGGEHGSVFSFKIDVQQGATNANDQDNDGVDDADDLCPSTFSQCAVDNNGCEIDSDNDGTCDALDATPYGDNDEEEPVVVEDTSTVNVQQEQHDNTKQEQEDKQEEQPEDDSGNSSVVPFLFGFLFGLVISVFFFLLVKS